MQSGLLGIFWINNGNIIAKTIDKEEVETDSLGNKDCPYQHIDEWETRQIYLPDSPSLRGTEYQEVPRGRVIFSGSRGKFVIYLDKSIDSLRTRKDILTVFELVESICIFKHDPHYKVFQSINECDYFE